MDRELSLGPLNFELLVVVALVLSAMASAVSLYIIMILASPPPLPTTRSERTYRSAKTSEPQILPSLASPPSLDLSVIVPAYNEVKRLQPMLDSSLTHLESLSSSRSSEIIIVDDGSTDGTADFALALAKERASSPVDIRVVKLDFNRHKGGAVKHGMLHARGQRLLFADADGASRFEDLELLWSEMDQMEDPNGRVVVVGSRAHLVKTDAVVKRSFLRNFLMSSFHLILKLVGVGYIRDTQCGFKLFSRPAALALFPPLHLSTWLFDVELLVLARKLQVPVQEVPIVWTEIPGSKMNLPADSLEMLRDLILLQANYRIGRWTPHDYEWKKAE